MNLADAIKRCSRSSQERPETRSEELSNQELLVCGKG
jgi:hypothetical protein